MASLLVYFNGFARKRAPRVEDLGTVKRLAKPPYSKEFGLEWRIRPLPSASGM